MVYCPPFFAPQKASEDEAGGGFLRSTNSRVLLNQLIQPEPQRTLCWSKQLLNTKLSASLYRR
jgi:hypothetical protein